LPALSINWGTWDVMRVANKEEKQRFEKSGLMPIPINDALQILEQLLDFEAPQICVASIDWHQLRSIYELHRKRPFFEYMTSKPSPSQILFTAPENQLNQRLEKSPPNRWYDVIVAHLRGRVRQVLQIESAHLVDADQGLFDMGMDSLMAVELRSTLEKDTGLELPSTLTFNYPAISDLATYLLGQLEPEQDAQKQENIPEAHTGSKEVQDPSEETLSEEELSQLLIRKLDELEEPQD